MEATNEPYRTQVVREGLKPFSRERLHSYAFDSKGAQVPRWTILTQLDFDLPSVALFQMPVARIEEKLIVQRQSVRRS